MVTTGAAPPRGSSAAAAANLRRRRTTSGGASAAVGNNMLQFYTDDAPGLKISPNVVLVMSTGFIAFVAVLHVFGTQILHIAALRDITVRPALVPCDDQLHYSDACVKSHS
ncbi:hypothetical protein IFM89_008439 [Coptis chinensis]|uniref:Protein transport protein Sec61 subunit beta n=1 Tax=Coptis chinensis TaxID=261450 RepID=A0A835M221_9MAGN|nr:hypothetical protein IFM89_008439 [Coptis chinensis]